MDIISVREHPETKDEMIQYFQAKWASENTMKIYEDCISHCITAASPLPQWYLLKEEDEVIGCAGLITNDFISRMDLYPWICAVYIEKAHRGNRYGFELLAKALFDAKANGYEYAYLCTDHVGYYEKAGFEYIGLGYHPWGESSRIYRIKC